MTAVMTWMLRIESVGRGHEAYLVTYIDSKTLYHALQYPESASIMNVMILFLMVISQGMLLTVSNTHHADSYGLPCIAVFADLANPTGYNTNHFPHGSVIRYNGLVIDQRDGTGIAGAHITVVIDGPEGSTVPSLELVSDNQGEFELQIQTEDFKLGRYMMTVTANVEQTEEGCDESAQVSGTFSVTRMYQYVIPAEGKDFDVSIQSIEYEISAVRFDKDSKSISLDVTKVGNKSDYSKDNFLQLDGIAVTIQRPLISPPFYVVIDNQKNPIQDYDVDITDERYSFEISDGLQESGTVTLIGTYVVPEFPVNLMIVAAVGLIPALAAIRINSKAQCSKNDAEE